MKLGWIGMRIFLAAALALALAAPAAAGAEVDDISKKLASGNPDGLTEMEAYCDKNPSASSAFLLLCQGYLRIRNDAGLAMDAALRGIEKYDDKAKEAQPALARLDAFRPAKLAPALAAQAQQLQAGGQPCRALLLYELAQEVARAGDLEASMEEALKPGRELAGKCRAEFDEALKLEGDKQLEALKALAIKYNGHTLGKEATAKVEFLKKPAAEREAAAGNFRAKPGKENPDDQVAAAVVVDMLVVTVTSPKGTGSAEVSTEKADWPKTVVLRFNLAELEVIQIDNGRKKLVGSLSRGSAGSGNERMLIEKKGNQVEVTLPPGFVAAAADVLKFSWIANYR